MCVYNYCRTTGNEAAYERYQQLQGVEYLLNYHVQELQTSSATDHQLVVCAYAINGCEHAHQRSTESLFPPAKAQVRSPSSLYGDQRVCSPALSTAAFILQDNGSVDKVACGLAHLSCASNSSLHMELRVCTLVLFIFLFMQASSFPVEARNCLSH